MTLTHNHLIYLHEFNTSDWNAVYEVGNQISTMPFKHHLNVQLHRHGFPLQHIQTTKILENYQNCTIQNTIKYLNNFKFTAHKIIYEIIHNLTTQTFH